MTAKEQLEKYYGMKLTRLLDYVCDLHGENIDFNDPEIQRKIKFIEKSLSKKVKYDGQL